MIVNMKFLTVTGPKDDIDRVTDKYLSRYEIQLENALSELKDVQKLRPFTISNPYKDSYNRVLSYGKYIDLEDNGTSNLDSDVSYDAILKKLDEIDKKKTELETTKNELIETLDTLNIGSQKIYPFRNLEYNIDAILDFRFIKFSFGKMPAAQYEKFTHFMYDELDVMFVKCMEENGFVWGVYFAPKTKAPMIDAIFSSLHFEKTYIPREYNGTPNDAYNYLQSEISKTNNKLAQLDIDFKNYLTSVKGELLTAKRVLSHLCENYDVRKLAAITSHHNTKRDYFILCGWITEEDAYKLAKEMDAEPDLYCYTEDAYDNTISTPPTKLKNPRLIKPFEMYIKMYGLPSYDEIDPTLFVAITYSFIFGAMFGDVGQGLCLAIGGFLLYKFKKINLAAIISCAGVFSAFFGFMYGSVFGFEDIIEAQWLHPASQMMTIPLIGRMNTVFICAIAFGMFLILFTMIIQIINAIKQKDIANTFFSTNGIAGFVFYGSFVLVVVLFMTGNTLPATIVLALMFGLPLILIALKEPLTNFIKKKSELIEGGKGMFIVQTFFELFEVLLSYFSNTLSFVRIGAFAISHAAMMEVVLMLAGVENGSPNMLVIILGNIFVCGMEGLIVGIQVLRLEYYEMFSRFYKGSGREFVPYKVSK